MKLFANKSFLFNEGGTEHKVPLGFSSAPDWVEKTDLFKAAVKEGSLKVVEGSTFTEGEKKLAEQEKAAYEARIAELEAKLATKDTKKEELIDANIEAEIETSAETNTEVSKPTKSKK